jgi:microcystin degradation protein MlrC
VLNLTDGKFHEHEPRHGGFSMFDQGRSAVVSNQGHLTILLTSRRMAPFSLAQITSCGINPMKFAILTAKGVIAPLAAYRTVCRTFIRVNTPGVTTADITKLNYANRRKPLYPFETNFHWSSSD